MAKVEYITRDHMKALLGALWAFGGRAPRVELTIAGQTGMNAQYQIVEGGLKAQALQAFRNIKEIIEFAGGSIENIVHLTWYLADAPSALSFMEEAVDVTMARAEILPGIAPGSTAVRVKALLTPEILIEI